MSLHPPEGPGATAGQARPGAGVKAYLLCGTLLQYGGLELRLEQPQIHLRVEQVEEKGYRLERILTAAEGEQVHYVLVGDTGYEIKAVEGRTIYLRDYPPVPCESLTLIGAREWVR